MRYLAAIDYEHLDNGMFLTGLARALSSQENTQPIILHADSAYTERVMQTGMMRDEAKIRAQKDLNHRLVALFADESVSAVGIHGYQRKAIRLNGDKLKIDENFFKPLPRRSAIILSTLVWDKNEQSTVSVSISRLSKFLQKKLETDRFFIFNKSDTVCENKSNRNWKSLSDDFKKKYLPAEFQNYNEPLCLTTAPHFQYAPDIKKVFVLMIFNSDTIVEAMVSLISTPL